MKETAEFVSGSETTHALTEGDVQTSDVDIERVVLGW